MKRLVFAVLIAPFFAHAAHAECDANGIPIPERITCVMKAVQQLRSEAALPKGAILHLAAEACPAGWSPYKPAEGRYVLSASGSAPAGSVGGSNSVKLSGNNMPSMNMRLNLTQIQLYQREPLQFHFQGQMLFLLNRYQESGSSPTSIEVSTTGAGEPIRIEPSYIALKTCIKD